MIHDVELGLTRAARLEKGAFHRSAETRFRAPGAPGMRLDARNVVARRLRGGEEVSLTAPDVEDPAAWAISLDPAHSPPGRYGVVAVGMPIDGGVDGAERRRRRRVHRAAATGASLVSVLTPHHER